MSGNHFSLFLLFLLVPFWGYSQKDTLWVDGSNGVRPLVVEVSKAFEKAYPAIRVEIGSGMSTSERIAKLQSGEIDVAMASHGIDIPYFTKQGLQVHWFAKMAIVIGVHRSVPIKKISEASLCAIYNGELKNWKELAGPDMSIVVLARPLDEVDVEVLQENLACFPDPKAASWIKVHEKSGPLARALAQEKGAIGMTAAVRQVQSNGNIKALSVGGVKPSLRNVHNNQYPHQRNAYLITKGLDDPLVKRYVQFYKSRTAKKILAKNAAAPAK